MEGLTFTASASLLFSGLLLLPTQQNLGIIFVSTFWAPYGGYAYCRRIWMRRPPSLPIAPVYEGPLPVSVVVAEEDPIAIREPERTRATS
jgi:hypothetical protein